MMRTRTAAWIAIATTVTACGGGGSDDTPPAFAQVCDGLVGKAVGAGKITATVLNAKTATVADTCVASGQIVSSPTSTINFRFELPSPAS
jgi:feruloyl esterase